MLSPRTSATSGVQETVLTVEMPEHLRARGHPQTSATRFQMLLENDAECVLHPPVSINTRTDTHVSHQGISVFTALTFQLFCMFEISHDKHWGANTVYTGNAVGRLRTNLAWSPSLRGGRWTPEKPP